ncbi:hypothetical protein CTEN210_14425 [Chaetoceros tenuissimus]|uniref:Uncharacterized protein n=1 Tax=Chaetoceros tenuissimus TaxID=426638 RepID=A0AAD3HCB8_9STRA|nr:hypothetical protein CTEN210_14425 [Chaetoceros tenuissimus]
MTQLPAYLIPILLIAWILPEGMCFMVISQTSRNNGLTELASTALSDIVFPSPKEPRQSQVQLWLDLRKTSVPPLTALLHLTNDLWDEYIPQADKSFIVDKVLVGENSSLKNVAEMIYDEFETEVSILVAEDDKLYELGNDIGFMTEKGSIIEIKKEGEYVNVDTNPLPVLDIVSKGSWVLLDKEKYIENDSITNLVELLSSSAPMFGSLEESTSVKAYGGVGLSCESQSDVVEMGAMIQALQSSKGYQTTDTGILVQKDTEVNQVEGDEGGSIEYALCLPFDAQLWKTSSYLFGAAENGDDSDIPTAH